MKLTKRKGFNFFRSYYDVYNELSDADKLSFMDALLDRQFLGVNPKELKGMAKFAYISQTHSIDSQVKGYEDKTKTKLSLDPTEGGTDAPTYGGSDTPTLQVEEKGEVEEKEQITIVKKKDLFDSFIDWFNDKMFEVKGVKGRYKVLKTIQTKFEARVKEGYNSEDFKKAFDNIVSDQYHKDNEYKYLTPEFLTRSDKLEKYCNIDVITKTETNKKKSLTMEELHKLRMA